MNRILISILLASLLASSYAQNQRRMVAEWEPAYGTLIRWPLGIPATLVVELAQDDSLYVLVENTSQQNQATAHFNSLGVNMDHCRFIFADTYSHWTRDWGPHYVFDEQGIAHIADPYFDGYPWVPGCNTRNSTVNYNNRGYEEDDAVNIALAQQLGLPLISMPLYLTGGNIMTDGHGLAVSTRQMLDENALVCDEECFFSNTTDQMGLFNYMIVENPETYGIQHIDCYAKFLDEETVLVKSVAEGHPEYHCIEGLAEFFEGEQNCYGVPYNVVRINCGSYNGNEVAAYTNSLILNKKVFVPMFGIATDDLAIQTYQEAMPGYEVLGFYYDEWYYYDALHCRTMGLFDPYMLRIWHKPLNKVAADSPVEVVSLIDDRSEAGLVEQDLKIYWREQGGFSWTQELLSQAYGTDSFHIILPSFDDGTIIEYYISAADHSGRAEKLPRTAPFDFYSFEVSSLVTGVDEKPENDISLHLHRNIPNAGFNIRVNAPEEVSYSLRIIDIHGRIMQEYPDQSGEKTIIIEEFERVPDFKNGVYIIQLISSQGVLSRKIFL